jgi:hypothetical protein
MTIKTNKLPLASLQEQNYEDVLCDLKAVPRKSKSNSTNKIKNGKPPRKPKTPSKLCLR